MDDIKWFKFNPSRWMMGKIQKCPEVTQARFMRLCSMYWVKYCEMTIEDAIIEIDQEHFDILKAKKIITIDPLKIYISFLDEQIFEIKEDKKDKSTSGIVGNLKRWHKGIYEQFISKNISLEKAIELSKIIADQSHPDSDPIATRSQNIADKDKTRLDLDKEEDKNRIDKEKNNTVSTISDELKIHPPIDKIDFNQLQKFFNDNRGLSPEVKKITEARKIKIKNIEKEYGKELIKIAIEKTRDSPFLQGQNNKSWIASFDWIFTKANFIKILEDNYAERKHITGKTNEQIFTDAMQSETAQNFRFK